MIEKIVRHSKHICDHLIYVYIVKGSPSLSKLTHSSGLYIYLSFFGGSGEIAFKFSFVKDFIYSLFYFWLHWALVAGWVFSSCGEQGLLLIAVLRLLVLVASRSRAQALEPRIIVVVHGLGCPQKVGSFLDQGSILCPLHRQVDS